MLLGNVVLLVLKYKKNKVGSAKNIMNEWSGDSAAHI